MKSISHWLAAIVAAILLVGVAHAARDPFLGTWRLDKAKSTIAHDPGVKSKTFVFSPTARGVMITETLEMLPGKGGRQISHLPYAYGKPTPQTGPGFDSLLVEKTGDRTVLWTVSSKGKVLSRLEVRLSADGKEMAFRYLSSAADPTGEVGKDRYVYVRQ
jgi:hypothetical protein